MLGHIPRDFLPGVEIRKHNIWNRDCEIRPETSPLAYIQRIVECFCGERVVEDYA